MTQAGTLKTTDGEEIAYFVDAFTDPWKPAPVMIMLHSLMGHSGRFYSMVPPFLPHFRVVRMDMRGHGGSSVPADGKPLTLERLTDDVRELMDHLDLPEAHVVANSAGGYLAQKLAIGSPERVKSLCLFGSTPGLRRSGAAGWLPQIAERGLRPFLAETIADRFPMDRTEPGQVEWFLDECAKNSTDHIVNSLKLFTSLDWSDELPSISCPTMIVAGGGETVGAADHYVEMRDRIPGSTLVYYPGLPHNICDIVPERCSSDVLRFLRWEFAELDHLP